MRKHYVSTLVLLVALLTFSTAALAADLDLQPKLELNYIFGKAEYSDADDNDFDDATLNGFRIAGQVYVWNKIGLAGSFFQGKNDEVLTVHKDYENQVPEGERVGTLTNSTYDIAAIYNVAKGMDIGAGWLFYGFEAEEYQYKNTRDYNGLSIVALLDMPIQDNFGVTGSAKFAPSMKVKDNVKGDWDNAERATEVEYDGSYMEAQLGVNYTIRDTIRLGAGYRFSQLKGDGKEDPEYRFLEHEYTTSGFYAGVSVAF